MADDHRTAVGMHLRMAPDARDRLGADPGGIADRQAEAGALRRSVRGEGALSCQNSTYSAAVGQGRGAGSI